MLSQKDAIAVELGLMSLALKVLMDKRKDYSGDTDPYANLRTSAVRGVHPCIGVQVRCDDKISRRGQMVARKNKMRVTNEKFADPYFDHINYIAIEAGLLIEELEDGPNILKMLYREAEQLPHVIEAVTKEAADVPNPPDQLPSKGN